MKWSTMAIGALAIVVGCSAGCTRHESQAKPVAVSSASRVQTLDDSNFDAEIRSGVVLVDFWATWCGPCKVQGPIVDEVAGQVEGRARVAKLDVDAAPNTAQKFNIRSIPTLVVFKDGKSHKEFVGVTEAEVLVAAISAALAAP